MLNISLKQSSTWNGQSQKTFWIWQQVPSLDSYLGQIVILHCMKELTNVRCSMTINFALLSFIQSFSWFLVSSHQKQIGCKASNECKSQLDTRGKCWRFPAFVESQFQEIDLTTSTHQQLVVTSSICFFAQVRPSTLLCITWSQFIEVFTGRPFHMQCIAKCPPFAFGHERKDLGNSGCIIALPWSQQLVISASSFSMMLWCGSGL